MTQRYSPKSSHKLLSGMGILLAVLMFDRGSMLVGTIFNGTGLHARVQAAANADHTTLALLKESVPGADSFSDKEGDEVPVYKAYRTDPATGEKTLIGYAVVTADFEPEPPGYSGFIDTLVGIDLEGKIVGCKVIYYKESLRFTIGDFFSWGFEDQFIGKTAKDKYRVALDGDIDGVAKATISSKAMARGVRRAVREVTKAYIR
mgnify:CR=1 FL=1